MSEAHHAAREQGTIVIDDGVRAWYSSCRCCLSDAHPEVVAVLDAERDAASAPRADAGICEVEEAVQASPVMEEVITMAQILDPVCDMIVDVEQQKQKGLTSELMGKTYAFCSGGCKKTFDKDPGKFTAKVSAWEASGGPGMHEHSDHHGH
jgi:YHS domain-containing protein